MNDLFCDGGVILTNPSSYGGSYAWVLIENDQIIKEGNGIVLPTDVGLPVITNNLMELQAALSGISQMEKGWEGTLWTDSQVTFFRLGSSESFGGIPAKMRAQCLELRRARRWQVKLLKGHPTQVMLNKGYVTNHLGKHIPVNKWNVYCDEKCQQLAKEFLENKEQHLSGL